MTADLCVLQEYFRPFVYPATREHISTFSLQRSVGNEAPKTWQVRAGIEGQAKPLMKLLPRCSAIGCKVGMSDPQSPSPQ